MDVLLLMPDELLSHLLLDWLDLATIARLDSVYVSHHSRRKFLSHISNASFVHDGHAVISEDDPVNKQLRLIQWLVNRRCRVRRVCLSIELQQYEEVTEFFRISGSSLHRIQIQNMSSNTAGDVLWALLLEHCHNLQDFCIKEHFPDYPNFLRDLSLHCPRISRLAILLRDGRTVSFTPDLQFNQLRVLQLTETGLSGALLAAIAPGSPRVEQLLFERAIDIEAEHFAILVEHCPLLHTVALDELFIGDTELQPLVTSCKNLNTLEITTPSWDDFTDLSLSHLAQNCLLLSTLHLHAGLCITDNGLKEVLIHCKALQHLFLNNNILLTDATLYSIAAHCPLLIRLGLRGRFSYSSDSLSAIAQSCTKLQQVFISTGRGLLKTSFPDVFASHVEVVVAVERAVKYAKEKSDEEHAEFAADLGVIGAGDY